MANNTVTTHVNNFVMSADPRGGFLKVAETFVEEVERDSNAREALSAIRSWLAAPLIDGRSKELYKRIYKPEAYPDTLRDPSGKTFVLASAYLRALDILRTASITRVSALDDLKKRLPSVNQRLKEIEPEFVGDLLIECAISAERDPAFAQKLADAIPDFRALSPQFTQLEARLQAILGGESVETTEGSQQKLSCTLNGQPAECWKVIAVVIIVVVLIIFLK